MKSSVIARTIHRFGEPVEFYPRVGQSAFFLASVQKPASDGVLNSLDMEGFVVYIVPGDVPSKPLKFDRLKVRGAMRALEEDAHEERQGDDGLVYVARVRG